MGNSKNLKSTSKVACALHENANVTMINCDIEGADTAYLIFGSKIEVDALNKAILQYPKEIEDLNIRINSNKFLLQAERESLIKKTIIFELLRGTASEQGIVDFLNKLTSK